MIPVRTHKFSNGVVRVSVGEHTLEGYCQIPDSVLGREGRWELFVQKGLSLVIELDRTIHEALHAEFPTMSERFVARGGAYAAKHLWTNGLRRGREAGKAVVKQKIMEELHAAFVLELPQSITQARSFTAASHIGRLLWRLGYRFRRQR